MRARIVKGSGLISAGTLATRALGFVREMVAAALFGTGPLFDAFVVAFSVPNLFRRVLGEEMFERAVLPPYKRLIAEGQGGRARVFLARISLIGGAALVVVSLVVLAVLPWLVRALAPGLDAATTAQAIHMSRLILPFLFLIGVASLLGAILQFSGRTLLFSMAPAVTNAVVIVVVLLLHESLSVVALVVAWLVGAAAAIGVQLPAVIRIVRALPRPSDEDRSAPVGRALRQGGHILSSAVVSKSVEVIDRIVASLIGAGAISALYFSFRMVHLPFSVLSLATSRAIAPELSRLRGERDTAGFAHLTAFGFTLNLFLLAPVVAFLMLFADEIVALLLGRGAFGAESIAATALAFVYYAPAILAMGLIALLNRVYSSLEDNRVPLMAAACGGVVNIGLDLLLYRTVLKQGGIALASSIGLSLQALLMLLLLGRFGVSLQWGRIGAAVLRLVPALAVFTGVVVGLDHLLPAAEGLPGRLLALGACGGAGIGVYALLAALLWPRHRPERMRVVLTGGGTGGHVYPALSIHSMLERHGLVSHALYLGVAGRAEQLIVPKHGLPFATIASAPYAGGSAAAKLRTLGVIAVGTVQSLLHLMRFRPHLVVATGGYVSAPVIVAAFLLKPALKLRIVVEEQNLVPGILNKVASLLADAVLVSFRETAYFIWSSRCVYTGYPVRSVYLEEPPAHEELRQRLGMPEQAFVILISGGSMGSRSINRVVADNLDRLAEIPDVHIVHAIGLMNGAEYDALADTTERLHQALGKAFEAETLTVRRDDGSVLYRGFAYLHDMADYQRAADLVIGRAGAGSLAEVLALGKPALLLPKRGLPGDHQELNAIGIADKGAAELLFERRNPVTGIDELDPELYVRTVLELAGDTQRRQSLAAGARRLHYRATEERVVSTVRALLEGGDIDVISEIVEPQFVRFQRQFDSLVAHLDQAQAGGLYHRLYDLKVEEYLSSPSFLTVNKGIKLVGALRRADLYPVLCARFRLFTGFEKRNALVALAKATDYEPRFAEVIRRGLADRYYETRREAVNLYSRFYREINSNHGGEAMRAAILGRIPRRLESFEVRAAALRAAVRLLDEEGFYRLAGPYRWARNVRLREAVLEAVELGLSEGLIPRSERVRRFIKPMLVTTSQFQPQFGVRQRYVAVVTALENGK